MLYVMMYPLQGFGKKLNVENKTTEVMKKIICISTIIIALIIGYSKSYNYHNPRVNDLLLDNVEALAEIQDVQKTDICWSTLTWDPEDGCPSSTVYCGNCLEMPYSYRDGQFVCKVKKGK